MFLVNMTPGRSGKPFFKVCVDKYEYPDKLGATPKTGASFEDANKFCQQQGKRLCTSEEWEWACGGMDGLVYPYGKTFDQERCNSNPRVVEESGNRINCVSPFGGFDMVGNIFEWVTAKDGKPGLMGGPFSKCQTVSPGGSGDAKPQSGLRCCLGN
jgi:formylglycine-generating enzyme required for sulfatase activity